MIVTDDGQCGSGLARILCFIPEKRFVHEEPGGISDDQYAGCPGFGAAGELDEL
jgi:hypothetical protein